MGDLDKEFDLTLYLNSAKAEREKIIESIYKRQYPFVYRLAYSLSGNVMEAEDVAQEVFIASIKGLATFRGESLLSTWLYRITTRICARHLARKPRHQWLNTQIDELPNSDRADSDIVSKELLQAILKLSIPMRVVLCLVAIEGLSHQTAADVLGVPVGTIWSRLHSARKQLSENLDR
jgi:RNA polymerase sigma-70 factor (ECF subfamily)